MTAEVVETSTN